MKKLATANGTILVGNCLDVLAGLPEKSVHMVMTSPPYWGLRDYGTATWEGGDLDCDHVPVARPWSGRPPGKLEGGTKTIDAGNPVFKYRCKKCGARRIDNQIGLEKTPEEYVAKLVSVFRAIRRVLRDDGTVWLNLGDSYATQEQKGANVPQTKWKKNRYPEAAPHRRGSLSVSPKNIVGIPWRVALALQTDGWVLRQDIIWSKPNPMPEPVTDRCTKSHEYLFLLAKGPRYYYDATAIQEPSIRTWNSKKSFGTPRKKAKHLTDDLLDMQRTQFAHNTYHPDVEQEDRNKRSVWTIPTPMAKLRDDLTPDQKAYVIHELLRRGLL